MKHLSLYRFTLVRDLVPVMSSFSLKKVMSAYKNEREKWKGEQGYQVLTNMAFHFYYKNRWRVVQVISDKLI